MIIYNKYTNTDELIELFQVYYSNPISNLSRLFKGIISYDFKDYNKFITKTKNLASKSKAPSTILKSNKTEYIFKSNPNIMKLVEDFLRYKHLNIHTTEQAFINENIVEIERSRYLYNNSFQSNTIHQQLEEIKKWGQNKIITGYAHTINQVQGIFDYLVNLDVPCFVKKTTTYINDQMIDWKSGINFWTCKNGHKHFLPIFANIKNCCFNLLNLNKLPFPPEDELIQTSDFFKCNCGRYRCLFEFTPHKNNFYDLNYNYLLNLANQLETSFRLIQFIDNKVYYKTQNKLPITCKDKEIIQNVFNRHMEFLENKYYLVGTKLPAFWVNNI